MKNIYFLFFWFLVTISFAQDGSPDLSFGDNGIKLIDLNANENYIYDFDQNEDGKIYSIGFVFNYNQQQTSGKFIMVNLQDGTLDSSFGDNGILFSEGTDYYSQIRLLTGGKILITGGVNSVYSIFRLLPDGSLDTTFGDNGYIQPTAQITNRRVFFNGNKNFFLTGKDSSGSPKIIVYKYHIDGSTDTDYGNNGMVSIPLGAIEILGFSATISPNGDNLFFTTKYTDVTTSNQVFKLSPNGNLDASFGDNGKTTIPVAEEFTCSSLVFSNQSVLVSCRYWDQPSEVYVKKSLKLNPSGSLNQNFGDGGYLGGTYASFIQENQRFVTDDSWSDWEGGTYLHLGRFFGNGDTDTSFQFDTNYFGTLGPYFLKPLKNGKILCAATSIWYDPPPYYLILQQFNNNPLSIPDFEPQKLVVTPNPTSGKFRVQNARFSSENAEYKIADVSGKIIKKGVLENAEDIIDISFAEKGIYFLKIQNQTFKLIKN